MVTPKSTAKRTRARKEGPVDARTGRARPAAPARARAPGLAGATIAVQTATGPEGPVLDAALLSDRLVSLLHGLSHSLSVLIVSVEALRRQDADAGSDIAKVLQQNVGDQMDIAIEELAQVIEIIDRHKARTDNQPRAEEGAKAA
jgi:hypothetical protein